MIYRIPIKEVYVKLYAFDFKSQGFQICISENDKYNVFQKYPRDRFNYLKSHNNCQVLIESIKNPYQSINLKLNIINLLYLKKN